MDLHLLNKEQKIAVEHQQGPLLVLSGAGTGKTRVLTSRFVYIVKNNTAEKRNIKIGNRNFGKISVESGIQEGDLVISEGVSKVRNKSKVKIINKK